MRIVAAVALAAAILAAPGSASADPRLDCIARCETPAAKCLGTAHGSRDACMGKMRKDCMAKPVAQQFDCLTTVAKVCSRTRASQTEACQATFQTCYVACGAPPAGQTDYWCSLDADAPGGGTIYRDWFCVGTPGGGADHVRQCVKHLKPAPTVGYSLECAPLLYPLTRSP